MYTIIVATLLTVVNMLLLGNMTHSVRHLRELFAPRAYTLCLDISQRRERTFSGSVRIHGELLKAAGQIVLHNRGLELTSATIDQQPATWSACKDDELLLQTSHKLAAAEHDIVIDFTGAITDSMHGLYPCYFTDQGVAKDLLMTQLESHYAREVFPCVDEPAAKATFELTLITEPDLTVLSNTPVSEQTRQNDALATSFETTPLMSPYLLAFVVGELEYLETKSQHGVAIRTYTTPGKAEQSRFALEFAAQALDYYDDYFGTPYPLPKCDMFAAPDFAAGAMENWGLVTYREAAMLVDPQNSSTDTMERVAEVVAHELSHQWFGNLVTMQWWDDLWLNESFADLMEHAVADHFHPEWQIWEQYSGQSQQYAFSRDGLAAVQAVKQPVHHPDELHGLFDPAIVYAKGACLLRMLRGYIGEETFRDGLRLYMKRHAYSNTRADDLWAALSQTASKDVAAFMNPWLTQPGHPILDVEVHDSVLHLSQQRFYANPLQAVKNDAALWPLPLLSKELPLKILDRRSATLEKPAGEFVLNEGYTGFYHTRYAPDLLEQLAQLVETQQLPTTNRLGLLADNLALSKAGHTPLADILGLIERYKHETAYTVWEIIMSVLSVTRMLVNDDPAIRPMLQRFIGALVKEEYERLGWEAKPDEPYFDKLMRPDMLALMAYAEDPAVVEHALQLFDNADKPEAIAPDVRSVVYTVAVRKRGEPAYRTLLEWYKHTTSAEERINLTIGITAVKDPTLAREITALFTTKFIKPQDLFYWFIYLMRNRYGRDATWEWMQTSWDWIIKQYKGDHDYADFPKYAASCMNTAEQLAAYKAFFTPKLDEADLAQVIRQGVEDIEVRVLWRQRDLAGVAAFLHANTPAVTQRQATTRPRPARSR